MKPQAKDIYKIHRIELKNSITDTNSGEICRAKLKAIITRILIINEILKINMKDNDFVSVSMNWNKLDRCFEQIKLYLSTEA